MRIFRVLKNINYKHYVCAGLTLSFVLCSVFIYPHNVLRLVESTWGLFLSVAFFFARVFRIKNSIVPTVSDLSSITYYSNYDFLFPKTWEEFTVKWGEYWEIFGSRQNFTGYLATLLTILYYAFIVIYIIFLIGLLIYLYFKLDVKRGNNNHGAETLPLKIFKIVVKYTYVPVKKWLTSFFAFCREHRAWRIAWIVIWLINLNILSIIISAISFLFYFAMSIDTGNIYTQVYKLFLDLSVGIGTIPFIFLFVGAVILVNKICVKIGYKRLNHCEMKNRGFINSLPVTVMNCGTMGSSKTTMLTDMALSQEVMFIDKAQELIVEHTMRFPNFPWILLENAVKDAISTHEIYNLATCRAFALKLYRSDNLFGYDVERYGDTFDNKLQHLTLWQSIESYVQLYFLYTLKTSFLVFNFSVRTDNEMLDSGNFPLWDTNFFSRDSADVDENARYAHILDFDAMRLGKKVKKNNPNSNFFEFGVVGITEIGKERGNMLENNDKKKSDEKTNQRNDRMESWLKMIRHSATVDFYCFAKVFTDDQRPESWGADGRELCEILGLRDKSDVKLARPGFFLFELLNGFIYSKFVKTFLDYRYNRGDTTLLFYLFRSLAAKMYSYYTGVYNTFGYRTVEIDMRRGIYDDPDQHKYYLANKKIFSKRFSTDCFSDFFTVKALAGKIGINDVACYGDVKATFSELASQNSYFIKDLISGLTKSSEDK